ncbi:type II toxin-antitoxin system VapC family toxin [Sphingomonas sp. HITSZ_GF]|uniref:type II toxin-antitoxin system VapC family toxin n=1 Tax=Sphingomonas sp. HITSZ_GF TaxID=3037247 RepID=UPI00240D9A23|nr:type II toxin-antitoxin system VapC family toxin [Sphingomonas sp. HITSZ_GF]MDG2533385.1 type II toxin-antitoxin system VapC family toxin [Sphingomonas sp. HITSZ_GF]
MDTNILVRAVTGDDAAQTSLARALLTEPFVLLASVLVETEWVLRSQYGWSRNAIATALAELIDLPALAEGPAAIHWAVERFAAGADFADMVHLVSAGGATRFVTFDRRLKAKAGDSTPLPIETLA